MKEGEWRSLVAEIRGQCYREEAIYAEFTSEFGNSEDESVISQKHVVTKQLFLFLKIL